ncbi:bifunctional hydroxymethylpyrimidine kinase/phosphomethylpyrimidine kinase [Parvularcula oceani]|uniref:bifunctional hydroxymethylpyrimidine kinase/phosphomethylpyrimidine kinase n=1 Tax=Parvularcula oceani TaxID=1247963 RepID=UPI0004E1E70A|nr:bifunctional hydroxymethylpyrimidine kinase/phosphomethylpyrimidine kinase [Parvularcula oceani]
MKGRVLIVAGSDSGGGAGIQADIKACTALGAYAATAVTAITVQDTERVHAVHPVPADIIAAQMRVVLNDIGADCVKLGMIGSAEAGEAILSELPEGMPVVLDPVLVATSGDALGDGAVAQLLRERFLPRAAVVTPNAPELAALSGQGVEDEQEAERAARALLDLGAGAVLAKAGHLAGDIVTDLLVRPSGTARIAHPRLESRNTHGTGCTLASALAAGLAQGMEAEAAARRAIAYTVAGIEHAPGFGRGHGPLNHALSQADGTFGPTA